MLLSAVRGLTEAVGYRKAAAAVGMSSGGLYQLLAGTDPHPGTIRKLTLWYVRVVAEGGAEDISADTGRAALAVLCGHLPPGRREAAEFALLDQIERTTAGARIPLPKWAAELRRLVYPAENGEMEKIP